MKKTCDYCGNYLSDTDEVCPHCGAPNPNLKRAGEGVPATIDELLAFCEKHRMPLEQMRFFIGEDCREARAFGVYQDDEGMFVVYKNKADGTRAVRYRGKDEAYAVNELYQKLQSELLNQKQHQAETRSVPPQENHFAGQRKKKDRKRKTWLIIGAVLLIVLLTEWLGREPASGYYSYGGNHYYSQSGNWYLFDNMLGDWIATEVDSQLGHHYQDYYDSDTYEYGSDYSDWGDSEYAYDYSDSSDWGGSSNDDGWDSDWDDDDWDYDYDDWDSGYTDWDSDW